MSNKSKVFDESEFERIRRMLGTQHNDGFPLDFEVKVDDKIVIYKTNKPERFDALHEYILEDSLKLSIAIYNEKGFKTFYKYLLNEVPETKDVSEQPVNGVDLEKSLNEKIALYEERSEAKRLREKLEDTERSLKEAEDYIDELTGILHGLQVKPNHLGKLDLAQLLSGTLEHIAISHPRIVQNIPVLNGIAKSIQESEQEKRQIANPGFEGDVSFRPKQAASAPAADERTAHALQLLDFIEGSFSTEQRVMVSAIIEELAKNPSQVKTVAELLNIELQDEDENS